MTRLLSLAKVCALVAASGLPGGDRRALSDDAVDVVIGGRTVAEGGAWQPESSPLRAPFGVDFNSAGAMYIVELGGGRVHRYTPAGELELIAGDGSEGYAGDGGPAAQARFNGMHNCVVSRDDELLIADSFNHCIRRIDFRSGLIDTLAGTGTAGFAGDGGPASAAQFDNVMCIALNPQRSVLHVADLRNRRVRNVDLAARTVATVAGNGSTGRPRDGDPATAGPLVDPRAVASDAAGLLYILERGGHDLRVVRRDGTIHTVAGTGKRGFRDGHAIDAEFASPKHLCCDPDGVVYIADDLNNAIRKYDPARGQVTTVLGRGSGDARIQLDHPHGVRWHEGSLYVVDSGNHRILRLRPAP